MGAAVSPAPFSNRRARILGTPRARAGVCWGRCDLRAPPSHLHTPSLFRDFASFSSRNSVAGSMPLSQRKARKSPGFALSAANMPNRRSGRSDCAGLEGRAETATGSCSCWSRTSLASEFPGGRDRRDRYSFSTCSASAASMAPWRIRQARVSQESASAHARTSSSGAWPKRAGGAQAHPPDLPASLLR